MDFFIFPRNIDFSRLPGGREVFIRVNHWKWQVFNVLWTLKSHDCACFSKQVFLLGSYGQSHEGKTFGARQRQTDGSATSSLMIALSTKSFKSHSELAYFISKAAHSRTQQAFLFFTSINVFHRLGLTQWQTLGIGEHRRFKTQHRSLRLWPQYRRAPPRRWLDLWFLSLYSHLSVSLAFSLSL